ncbi:unnamed protein product [Amaranthus hypochondriacus]
MQPKAVSISRALISASNNARSWCHSLDNTLHKLGCRDSLTPSLVAQVIDPHLLRHPSLSLGFFNWASQQPNFSHSSVSYNSILKSLSVSRQFKSLEKILREAKSRKLDIDSSFYRPVIASLVKSKKSHEGFLILVDAISLIHDVGVETCNLLLAGLVSEGRLDCAHKVFDEMLVRGVSFTTLGFGLFMWRYCQDSELGLVLDVLEKVKGAVSSFDGSIIALLIIHGLCEVGRASEAYSALEELRKRDCKPDFMAYRIVAECFTSKGPGCMLEMQVVLKKKRKLGVAPRSSDYGEFIISLLSKNMIYEAKELGLVILEGNFPIEDDVLNALIASVSSVDPSSAMLFFKFMVGKEKAPTLSTLNSLSKNLRKHGKIDDMLDVLNTLSSKDYFTNLESYYAMILSLCEAGCVREAYDIFQEMRKKGIHPDISCYNILMDALCREDLIRPAKKLWDEMFSYGVDGNLKSYSILIKKFAEIGQIDEAQILFDHMLNKGVMPDSAIYTFLLECLCHNLKFEAAIQMFYKVADQDMAIAEAIVTPLVLSLCKAGCLLYASKFLCSNCHLRHTKPHVILLSNLADARQFETAIDHLRQVMAASPSLLEEISTEILALVSSSSNPESILQLLQEMQQNDFVSMNDNWRSLSAHLLT